MPITRPVTVSTYAFCIQTKKLKKSSNHPEWVCRYKGIHLAMVRGALMRPYKRVFKFLTIFSWRLKISRSTFFTLLQNCSIKISLFVVFPSFAGYAVNSGGEKGEVTDAMILQKLKCQINFRVASQNATKSKILERNTATQAKLYPRNWWSKRIRRRKWRRRFRFTKR